MAMAHACEIVGGERRCLARGVRSRVLESRCEAPEAERRCATAIATVAMILRCFNKRDLQAFFLKRTSVAFYARQQLCMQNASQVTRSQAKTIMDPAMNPALWVFGNGLAPDQPGAIPPGLPVAVLRDTQGLVGLFSIADPSRNYAAIAARFPEGEAAEQSVEAAVPVLMVAAGPRVGFDQIMTMAMATTEDQLDEQLLQQPIVSVQLTWEGGEIVGFEQVHMISAQELW